MRMTRVLFLLAPLVFLGIAYQASGANCVECFHGVPNCGPGCGHSTCGDLEGTIDQCMEVGCCRGCAGFTCPVSAPSRSFAEEWEISSTAVYEGYSRDSQTDRVNPTSATSPR